MTISPAYPDLLQNGNPADASQVMADFYQIQNDVNANAAHNGANSDITSLTGLTTPLGIAYGGTGASSSAAALTALGALSITNNLSDVASASAALTNLGGAALTGAAFTGNISTTGNISAAGTLAVAGAAAFSTTPTFPTAAYGTSSTAAATTAFLTQAFTAGQSLSTPGYLKLPGGLIIQWGGGTTFSAVTFPVTFPNAVLSTVVTVSSPVSAGHPAVFSAIEDSATTSGFTAFAWLYNSTAEDYAFTWIAIGY